MGGEVDTATMYDDLKPEDFPLMGRDEAVVWIANSQRAARAVGIEGQIRVDRKRDRLVRLLEPAYDVLSESEVRIYKSEVRIYKSDWHVEDVLTGERLRINMFDWSEVMNEMEILAWASK